MNPADDASRGVSANDLVDDSRWIKGPAFLWQSREAWPTEHTENLEVDDDDAEIKKSLQSHSVEIEMSCDMNEVIFSKFSSWTRLKRAVS